MTSANPRTMAAQTGGGDVPFVAAALGVGLLLALYVAARAADPLMSAHAFIFAAAFVGGGFALVYHVSSGAKSDPTAYEFGVVKAGVFASTFWGIAGFLVGVVIAAQLAFPNLFYFSDFGWTNFGRLRPLHTSAVIFAFGGNVLIATSFYVVQRTCRAKLWGGLAPWFVFWGYQLFIVIAATGYLIGVTQSREYAEPEWYADLWLTIVWVVYLLVFLGTILKRKEPHIYVANWFYLAFIVTIAMLHIVNNLAVPVSLTGVKSYSLFAGVQDALTQWWYGHNAVGFFLTAGFLAIMYYFIPKKADRPVYSYRLSIIHFWALIFIYIWAGPHHLHYTALPEWAQTLGMTFSIMLWMPSWGGMINGLMTLSGAWDKLRRLLRHVDLRRPADVGARGELALALYRLDHRPRPLGRARLGRLYLVRRALLPHPLAVEAQDPLFERARRVAFLDLDHRHSSLHHLDVGVGDHARSDVARLRHVRLPRIFFRRDRRGDASLLHHPDDRRSLVPDRRLHHGLQSLADGEGRRARTRIRAFSRARSG